MKKVILFDIDGTLVRDEGSAGGAFLLAFKTIFNKDISTVKVSKAGRTDVAIIQDVAQVTLNRPLELEELILLNNLYIDNLTNNLISNSTMQSIPGALELVTKLHSLGDLLLGIQTGNVEQAAWLKLKHCQLDHYFSFGGFCTGQHERHLIVKSAIDQALHIDPSNTKENILIVGDTPHDITAAHENGVSSIGVTTGHHTSEELLQAKPLGVVENFMNIEEFLNFL